MTNDQKKKIIELRGKGLSMSEVAKETGISINTVKSFCRRQKGKPVGDDVVLCRYCGKPVHQNPGRKMKVFCSDAHRMLWWNEHPEMVQHKHIRTYTCAHCGKTFEAYGRKARKYCSEDCYFADRFGGEKA